MAKVPAPSGSLDNAGSRMAASACGRDPGGAAPSNPQSLAPAHPGLRLLIDTMPGLRAFIQGALGLDKPGAELLNGRIQKLAFHLPYESKR